MSKITKFVLILLAVMVLSIAGFIFASRNSLASVESYPAEGASKGDFAIEVPKQQAWFDAIGTQEDFAYPVTETEFTVKFLDPTQQKANNQVIIKDINEEMLFCLREVLKEKNVNFAYSKAQNKLDIIVYLEDNRRPEMLKLLRYYGILDK